MKTWYALTGGPCVGKTTLLRALQERGYGGMRDEARAYVEEELREGHHIVEIRGDAAAFEREVLRRKVLRHQEARGKGPLFFDGGLHDSAAYFTLEGIYPDDALESAMQTYSYEKVFLLEPLVYMVDNVRTETPDIAQRIRDLIPGFYERQGMRLIRVPVLPVPERVDFVLSQL